MHIANSEIEQQKSLGHAVTVVAVIVVLVAIVAVLVYLRVSTVPTLKRGAISIDSVKRGPMVRQLRGTGSLVPSLESVLQIPAQTEANVVRICTLPGSLVNAHTLLVELSNPQVEQEATDAQFQWKTAVAEYQSQKMRLELELMNQKSSAASIRSDYDLAQLQLQTDKALHDLGVISELDFQASKLKAAELTTRRNLADESLAVSQKVIDSQLAEWQARLDQMRAQAELRQKHRDLLQVRAGIDGVLMELPLQVGEHVLPGAMLAKVVQPNHLMAELKTADGQARDIQIGEPASIDTHNGIIPGVVTRVDLGVQNGPVTVDIKPTVTLPEGARSDLSVDLSIDMERLNDVLYVARPASVQENSTISLFKLEAGGREAIRVPVKVGRTSANSIQVVDGLRQGDTVVLSDMSRWVGTDRIRLED